MTWAAFVVAAAGLATVEDLLEERTLRALRAVEASLDGVLGVAAIDLTSGKSLQIHGDVEFPQASVIKIPLMVEMFHAVRGGAFRLDDTVALDKGDAVGGSGRLGKRLAEGPVRLTVRELMTAMIEWSDNTATNKCIAMAGMEAVNRRMDAFGLSHTRLRRRMMDSAAARRDQENTSTPMETARLLEMIWRGKAAHPDDCREMIAMLKLVEGAVAATVPDGVEVAAKTGAVDGARAEGAIVFLDHRPFVLVVNSAYLGGRNPVAEVTLVVFDHFQRLARSNRYGRFVR